MTGRMTNRKTFLILGITIIVIGFMGLILYQSYVEKRAAQEQLQILKGQEEARARAEEEKRIAEQERQRAEALRKQAEEAKREAELAEQKRLAEQRKLEDEELQRFKENQDKAGREAQRRQEQEKAEEGRRLRAIEQQAKEEKLKRDTEEAGRRDAEERNRQAQIAQRKGYLGGEIQQTERNIKAKEAQAAHEYKENVNEAESRRYNTQVYNYTMTNANNIKKIRELEIEKMRNGLEQLRTEYNGLK